MIFPFLPSPACFFFHWRAIAEKKQPETVKGRNVARGGWQGVRSGAVCAKRLYAALLFGATSAHKPERPTEPWLKGVHPREAEGGEDAKLPRSWVEKRKTALDLYAFRRNPKRHIESQASHIKPRRRVWDLILGKLFHKHAHASSKRNSNRKSAETFAGVPIHFCKR